jgi:tRNA pseudouridine55 synthase
MDVCRVVRRRLINAGAPKRVKVGHGGTLDPLATGVLVVLVGKATRLCDQVMAGAKRYEAVVDLSAFTTTDDAEGERTVVDVPVPPTLERVRAACVGLTGVIMQSPPAYSAMKVDGQRAYKLARAGKAVSLAARPVRVDAIEIVSFAWPMLSIAIDCGKGVYVRSLARDLGVVLGTGGTLAALRRTRVGAAKIERAITLADVPDPLRPERLLDPALLIGS